jgi:ATP-dependent RNA/DNA helicase IGHMBP2
VLNELKTEIRDAERLCVQEVVDATRVVCCTNTGAADKFFKREGKNIVFDLVVIDECAQALEISCWIPILKGARIVLVGDHK